MRPTRRSVVLALTSAAGAQPLLQPAPAFAQADPLPSWNDGAVGQSILDFDKTLDEAAGRRWTIVDMKRDWTEISPPATTAGGW